MRHIQRQAIKLFEDFSVFMVFFFFFEHNQKQNRNENQQKNKNKAKVSERNMLETKSNRHNANYACRDA